jgi:integrase
MFIQLGLRPEELIALRRNDVGDEFIRIDEAFTKGQIKETKTEESAANVYILPDLMVELRTWMESTSGKMRTGCSPLPVAEDPRVSSDLPEQLSKPRPQAGSEKGPAFRAWTF